MIKKLEEEINISNLYPGRVDLWITHFKEERKENVFLQFGNSAEEEAYLSDNESDLLKFRVRRSMETLKC